MILNEGERTLVAGPTGCGKTTFSSEFCFNYLKKFKNVRYYALNSKYGDDFKSWPSKTQFYTKGEPPRSLKSNERFQIWSPLHISNDSIDIWLKRILNEGSALLNIDEIIHLIIKRGMAHPRYDEICKIGRSRGISVIANTQELTGLPSNTIKQSTHFVRFRLITPYEKSLSQRLLNSETKLSEPEQYGFYYGNLSIFSKPEYYSSYKQFFKEF